MLSEKIQINKTGWGPTKLPEKYKDVPFAYFGRGERCGRVADFIGRDHGATRSANSKIAKNEENFNLVDTAKAKTGRSTIKSVWTNRKSHYQNTRKPADVYKPQPKGKQLKYLTGHLKRGKQFRRPRNTGNRSRQQGYQIHKPTLTVEDHWRLLDQFELQSLTKLQVQPPTEEDTETIKSVGALLRYDETMDKVRTTSARKLDSKRFNDVAYPHSTTREDPVMRELVYNLNSEGKKLSIFCTDEIMSILMVAPRSYFPWDISVTKLPNGVVFLDKRPDDTTLHKSNVYIPPTRKSADDKDTAKYNQQENLDNEATDINYAFRQQCMISQETKPQKLYKNSSSEELDAILQDINLCYKYRKFTFDTFDVYVRTEAHALCKVGNKPKKATIFALNEWDSKLAQTDDWRIRVDNQRGSLLALEMKNNSLKLARWAVQALLSGNEVLKIGFVSRKARNDPTRHDILGTQSYEPNKFAAQINLKATNIWGIFKGIMDFIGQQDSGSYVVCKDPTKQTLQIYKTDPQDEEANQSEEENSSE